LVALLVFAVGAGVSFYEGVMHILTPEPMETPLANYIVLLLSAVFEGVSWTVALREFRTEKGELGYIEAIRKSKDPTTYTVLVEDTVALAGLAIAFLGIFLSQLLDEPRFDGIASVLIALLLAAVAIFLARESKNLLIGEPALPEVRDAVLRIAAADPAIRRANGVITTQLGPDQVIASLSVEFADHLSSDEIERCVTRLESAIQKDHPEVTTLFVKPQAHGTWADRAEQILEDSDG
jgi:divalent metal cation (Fe/Co/Zn/Cd) transporter